MTIKIGDNVAYDWKPGTKGAARLFGKVTEIKDGKATVALDGGFSFTGPVVDLLIEQTSAVDGTKFFERQGDQLSDLPAF